MSLYLGHTSRGHSQCGLSTHDGSWEFPQFADALSVITDLGALPRGLFPRAPRSPLDNVQSKHRPPRRFEPVDGVLLPRLPVSPSVEVSINKDSVMFCHVNGSLSKNIGEMAWCRYRGESLVTWKFSNYSANTDRK